MKKEKALFVYVGRGSFVKKDVDIFSDLFELTEYNFIPGAKWKTPFQLIHQLLFLCLHIFSYRIIIIQLSGFHAFFPALLARITGKKCFIIAAGTDCHSFPSIGYGNYQKKLLAFFTRQSFRLCSNILPKHETLWYSTYTYSKSDYEAQGIKSFNPELNKPHTVIENGFDSSAFSKKDVKETGTFLAVPGGMHFPFQMKLKGIDLILQAAFFFPDLIFTIVGIDAPEKFTGVSPNVRLLPSVPNSALAGIYSAHRFFFQLSMAEGFPNSLCESMLCECIPIGSDVFSIPEIIGPTGFVLKKREVGELKSLIEVALKQRDSALGKQARKRIVENYSLEKRRQKFIKLFTDLGIPVNAEY